MNHLPDSDYHNILSGLKEKIRLARQRTALRVNAELLYIYWEIGNTILEQQKEEKWGAKVIDRLSADLRMEFADMKGFSVRNLKYMRAFAEAYPDFLIVQQAAAQLENEFVQAPLAQLENYTRTEFVQQPAAQIPWTHHQVILDKLKNNDERLFYMRKSIENGWSRNRLALEIDTGLYSRQGKAITNFPLTLPALESDLATETLKSPYVLDFLGHFEEMKERELERALIQHLKKFMLELGRGFAYVGNQKNIIVDGDDFFLDLLFFNYNLNCFVIIELKVGDFKPEFAGKLNFYVNTVNEQLKGPNHKPTIGVLLCKTPNKTVVEFSLKGIDSPIGVADYELAKAIPKELKGELPSIAELEAEIEKEYQELKSPGEKRLDVLKQKLASIKGPEIQITATKVILTNIIEMSLKPMFEAILESMKNLASLFVSSEYYWNGKLSKIENLGTAMDVWKAEDYLFEGFDKYFHYSLKCLLKSGKDEINSNFRLQFHCEKSWYGFTLINYNNQRPFLKKMYHEQLSEADIKEIVNVINNFVIDDIENDLKQIEQNNE